MRLYLLKMFIMYFLSYFLVLQTVDAVCHLLLRKLIYIYILKYIATSRQNNPEIFTDRQWSPGSCQGVWLACQAWTANEPAEWSARRRRCIHQLYPTSCVRTDPVAVQHPNVEMMPASASVPSSASSYCLLSVVYSLKNITQIAK